MNHSDVESFQSLRCCGGLLSRHVRPGDIGDNVVPNGLSMVCYMLVARLDFPRLVTAVRNVGPTVADRSVSV